MSNRLARETSPYLLQHKNNPVDWYPWGPEALGRAKSEDKPILLSVGYSACHWCHVMEHESFENAEISALMNENFVNIKVDREERPDLDQIYQNVAQAITRSGGWPLTVFLTPELKPYFGGTYFPPDDRWGRPGFPKVLKAMADAYRSDRTSVADNARKLSDFIKSLEAVPAFAAHRPSREELEGAADELAGAVDPNYGGFGGAPKFPNVMAFTYLWRMGLLKGSATRKDAVLRTLESMAKGGIYDQLGGGFARYSVDESWSVPHFEKMLYDNGLLLRLYSEVLLSDDLFVSEEHEALFVPVVADTVAYLLREMRAPEGGFYAAQDADSEGEEGKFFVWSPEDLAQVLTPEELRVAAARFGVTPEGNFESSGKTVLHIAGETGDPILLASARRKLLAARSLRVAPGRDDKVLASWNGLMISGLCWASRALAKHGRAAESTAALEAARGAFRFVLERMSRENNRLFATFQGGAGKLNAYLDDYAFLSMAALDLARTTSDEREAATCLERAAGWVGVVRERFRDSRGAGWFFTSDDHEDLLHRPKTIFDQAIPSGTGVMLGCLSALAELTGSGELRAELESQLGALFPIAARNPHGCGETLCAALLETIGPVVVSGPSAETACAGPHLFRKPGDRLVVCHRGTCGLPHPDPASARAEALTKLA